MAEVSDTLCAITGTYSDLKVVKSRAVAVVCIEIPIERMQEFVARFGAPTQASETWVALARLASKPGNPSVSAAGASEVTSKGEACDAPGQRVDKYPLARDAALRCKDAFFQRFVVDRYCDGDAQAANEEAVAVTIRRLCGVKSRGELDTNPRAADKWRLILGEYDRYTASRMGRRK